MLPQLVLYHVDGILLIQASVRMITLSRVNAFSQNRIFYDQLCMT